MTGQLATWVAVSALAVNYGARAVIPVVAHVVCRSSGCDAAGLIGSVASAFFTGDLLAQAAAKPLARQLGGRRLLSGSMAGLTASLSLVTLLVKGPIIAFLVAQGLFGFFCGLGYPASHALIAELVSANRRSTAVALIQGASAWGTMLSSLATPFMVECFGWVAPFLFYCVAGGLMVPVIEVLLASPHLRSATKAVADASPAKTSNVGGSTELLRWLADPLVQALVLAMYASGVANAFLYTFVPTLFVEVYQVQLSELAWLTSSAPLLNAGVCVLSGVLADKLLVSGWSTHRCRALMQFLGTAIPAASLLALASGGALSTMAAAILVTIWMAAHGFQTAGLTATFHDVGKLRASELFSLGNIFSKLAGVLAGQAFSPLARARGWETVLLVIAAHYVAAGVIFICCLGRSDNTRRLITQGGEECQEAASQSAKSEVSGELPRLHGLLGTQRKEAGAGKHANLSSPAPSVASVASTTYPDPEEEDERGLSAITEEWGGASDDTAAGTAEAEFAPFAEEETQLLAAEEPTTRSPPSSGEGRFRGPREGAQMSPRDVVDE